MALSQVLFPLFYSSLWPCHRCCSHSSIVHCGPVTGAVPIFYSSLWPCHRCCSHSSTVPVAGAVPILLRCLLQVLFPLFYGACCRCCSHSSTVPVAGAVPTLLRCLLQVLFLLFSSSLWPYRRYRYLGHWSHPRGKWCPEKSGYVI